MNIFEIERNLQDLYDNIEENGGEVDDEILDQLTITEQNLKDKVRSYTEVIKQLQYDVKNIQEEKSRLDNMKKSKEILIARLQNILLNALDKFGEADKKGVKSIDYGIGRISTRKSSSVEVNEGTLEIMTNGYFRNMQWLAENNQLGINQGLDKSEYVEQLNAERDENITKLTTNELNEVNVDINMSVPLGTLFDGTGYSFAGSLLKYNPNFKVKPSIDKTRVKSLIKAGGDYSAIANVKENINLAIK